MTRWRTAREPRGELSDNATLAIQWTLSVFAVVSIVLGIAYVIHRGSQEGDIRQQESARVCMENDGIWLSLRNAGDMCIKEGERP